MKRLIFICSVLTLLGCQTNSAIQASTVQPIEQRKPKIGEAFEMTVGETVSLDEGRLRFQFDSVPEDSRCPLGQTCFWAGNAVAVLKFGDGKVSLNTNLEPHAVVKGNYTIRLSSLSQYHGGAKQMAQKAYKARFVILRTR